MIDGIADWLKTTVLGVIVLGTCGSLLALIIIYLLKKLFRLFTYIFQKLLPAQAARILAAIKRRGAKVMFTYGYRLGEFTGWNPTTGVAYFFSYHLLCTICLLIIFATLAIIIFVIISGTKTGPLLTMTTFLLIVLAILSAFWSFRHFLHVFLSYRYFPDIQKSTILATKRHHKQANETSEEERDQKPQHPAPGDRS